MWKIWQQIKLTNEECSDLYQLLETHNHDQILNKFRIIFSNNNQLEWIKSILHYNSGNKHHLFLILDLALQYYDNNLLLSEIIKKHEINDPIVINHMKKAFYSQEVLDKISLKVLPTTISLSCNAHIFIKADSDYCNYLLFLLDHHENTNLVLSQFENIFQRSYQISWVLTKLLGSQKNKESFSTNHIELLKIVRKFYPKSDDEIYWTLINLKALYEKPILDFILKGNYSQIVKDDLDLRLYFLDKNRNVPSLDVIDRIIDNAVIHKNEPYNIINLVCFKMQLGTIRIKKIISHCKSKHINLSLKDILLGDSANFAIIWEMLHLESDLSEDTIKKIVYHCKYMSEKEVYLIGTKLPQIYSFGACSKAIERSIDILEA